MLLDRQLALVIDGGRVVRTITISSGAAGTPTPPGSYSVFRKEQRSWSVPFSVWLPWASYFVGGIAFHEYADVPPFAASHGCVRTPRYDAKWLYDQTPIGTKVDRRGELDVRRLAHRHRRRRCWRSPQRPPRTPRARCRRSCPTR